MGWTSGRSTTFWVVVGGLYEAHGFVPVLSYLLVCLITSNVLLVHRVHAADMLGMHIRKRG